MKNLLWNDIKNLQANFPQRPPGSVLIDNSTLKSALGFLDDRRYNFYRRSDAWPISLISLRHLVESLILFDFVYVDQLDLEWALTDYGNQAIGPIGEVIHGINLSDENRNTSRNLALDIARKTSQDYNIPQLASAGSPSAEAFWILQLCDRKEEHILQKELEQISAFYGGSNVRVSRSLAFATYRTAFYLLISQIWGIPYCPHPVRTPFVAPYLQDTSKLRPESIRNWAIQEVANVRSQKIVRLNAELGTFYEVEVPLLFGIILSESKSSEEILQKTIEIRNSWYAKGFRRWTKRIDEAIQQRRDPVLPDEAFEEVRALCDEFAAQRKTSLWTKVGIAVGMLPQVSVEFDVKVPLPWKRHLLFLKEIFSRGMRIGELATHIEQLFGKYW